MLLKYTFLCLLALFAVAFVNAAKIELGRGSSMAIACATQMTNAGATNRVIGDTVSPSGADAGFGLVVGGPIVTGTNYWTTADGAIVTGDCANAATHLNGLPSLALASSELSGTHLAGVWKTGADCTVTGAMVLDAQNVADAQFVFIIGGTLTVGLMDSPFTITVINGGSSCNVFFTVAGKIDIYPGSAVHGSFISQTAVNVFAGSKVYGRAWGITADVTIAGDLSAIIDNSGCADFNVTKVVPAQVAIPTVSLIQSTSLRLSWQKPLASGLSPARYFVRMTVGGSKLWVVKAPTTTLLVTGLTKTTAYQFTVQAQNSVGNSTVSVASLSATTLAEDTPGSAGRSASISIAALFAAILAVAIRV